MTVRQPVRKKNRRRNGVKFTRNNFILLLLVMQMVIFCSTALAAHTYIVAPVSGLQARAQLTVMLPDCSNYQWDWGDGTTSGTFILLSSGTTNYFHTFPAAGTYNVALVCGGVFDPAYPVTVPVDAIAPTISITSPTSSPTYATTVATISIGGSASDNVGVTQVTWSNNRGGSGTAAGTTSWTVAGIALLSGVNEITVRAADASGNTSTDTISVTYTAPDAIAPTITITSPTSSPTYATTVATISIGGSASDNVGVTQVTWLNTTTEQSGTATGTTSWNIAGILLQPGSNVITVTARDAAGNGSTDTLTITFTPPSGLFTVTPSPVSGSVIPGQQNVNPVIFNAMAAGGGSFTVTSAEGRFVTEDGMLLYTNHSPLAIAISNGSGTVSETAVLPAAVVAAALKANQNRILYERTFAAGAESATARVTYQVVPATAGPFSLVRMELLFLSPEVPGNAAGRVTVPLNCRNLRAAADLTYNGGGMLRAQWKVDGQVVGYVTRYIPRGGRQVRIESPVVPGLPTYDPGQHRVELEMIDPVAPFAEPVIFYFISPQGKSGENGKSLQLILPVDRFTMALSPEPGSVAFSWAPLEADCRYHFEILPPDGEGTLPVIQARTRSGFYTLSVMEVETLEKGIPYRWHVRAYAGEKLIGSSRDRIVYFTSPASSGGGVIFQYLDVTERPEEPQSFFKWFRTDQAWAAETGGSLFSASKGQQLLIRAGIKNESGESRRNIRVEFLVDGQAVDATFISVLNPGETKVVEGLYEVPDDRDHALEVRALEGAGAASTLLASIGGELAGVAQEGTEMRAGEASPSRPIIPTSLLVMTGLTSGRRVIHTPALEMTGLTSGRRVIHTPALEMTGLTPGRRVIHTSALVMTGIGPQPNEMRQVGPTRMESSGNQVLDLQPARTNPTTYIPLSSLSIVQPNGGEVWRSGRSYGVLWRNRDFHEDIRIRLLGTDGRSNRVLYRNISADIGRALVHIPPDVPTGNYKMSVESLDHAVHDESNGAFTIRGIGGFTAPDFQILDIQHLVNPERIAVHIRNNGIPWHDPIVFRIVYHDPDGSYSETRNTTLDLILGAGESKWIDIIDLFMWQDPLNMPKLVFLAQVDPDGQIVEFDEGNNQFQKEIALPCGLHISGLSHSWLYEGLEAQIFLYGTFGSERKSKTVGVLDEENHLYKVFPREWQPGSLEVDLQNFPAGLYRFVVYCSDPDGGSAYSSNISSWVEIRRPGNHSGGGSFPSESPAEAGRIAGALSDEFVPAGTNAQVRIQRIWIEHAPDGWKAYASIHGALSVFLEQVVFEIWKDAERIRYGEVRSFHMAISGNYEESFIFQRLHDGAYTLKCKILDTGGNHNEASLGFILSGTQVQANN